jgi:hypothetical protein
MYHLAIREIAFNYFNFQISHTVMDLSVINHLSFFILRLASILK